MEHTYRLKKPLILLFNFDGIEREEAVTRVTCGVRVRDPDERDADVCRSFHSRIDMAGLDPFTPAELESFDVTAGLREAYDAATARAHEFCEAKAATLPKTPDGEIASARMAGQPLPAERPYLEMPDGTTFGREHRSVPPVQAETVDPGPFYPGNSLGGEDAHALPRRRDQGTF